jgi:hypothetical protein
MDKKSFFRNGLIAAVLLITLGYTACSDDIDYNESSSYQSSELQSSSGIPFSPGDSVTKYKGLLLTKIYFTGSGYSYHPDTTLIRDQYFRITNNSDTAINAAGVAILESKFVSPSDYYDFSDSISNQNFVTQVIYRIPPRPSLLIPPDSSLVIAYQRENLSPDGLDLSHADYGWTAGTPAPLLEEIFTYSQTVWILHNRGFRSYAIAGLPASVSDTTDLINLGWKYSGTYKLDVGDTTYTFTTTKAYKIPNEWIIDAVNVVSPVEDERDLHTLPYILDTGFTDAGDIFDSSSPDRFKHAVTRRKDQNTGKYLDSDDSSKDFIPNDSIYNPWP